MTWKCSNCDSGEVLSMVSISRHYRLTENMEHGEDVSDGNPLYTLVCDNGCGEITESEMEWVDAKAEGKV